MLFLACILIVTVALFVAPLPWLDKLVVAAYIAATGTVAYTLGLMVINLERVFL